ncbi:MAG: Rab family GTPase [Candidatus Helarchaeota archaeon]
MRKLVPERKILLLGANAVGKTTLFKSIIGEMVDVSYRPSLSVNIGYKIFNLNGKQVGLRIWDLGGQLLHRPVWRNYYANTNGAILMYDITRKNTFLDIMNWKLEMRKHIKKKFPVILVGNKCDLVNDRRISIDEGKKLKKKLKARAFFETSALYNTNVSEVFQRLLSMVF